MTLVQPIPTAEHNIVASILNLGMISLSRLDVDIFERPIEAWCLFGAVEPCYAVVFGGAGKVGEVNVGPSVYQFEHENELGCSDSKM